MFGIEVGEQSTCMLSIATLEAPARAFRVEPVPMVPRATSSVAPSGNPCSTCHLRDLCLPCGLSDDDVQQLDRLSFARRRVSTGQTLYRAGDRFQLAYAVCSGTFKTSLTLADGREQVSGFHMAGELMGLDGVPSGFHASSATALEGSMNAEERMVVFLLNLSQRFKARGYSPVEFHLRCRELRSEVTWA